MTPGSTKGFGNGAEDVLITGLQRAGIEKESIYIWVEVECRKTSL